MTTADCKECGEEDSQLHYLKCQSEYFREARQHAWVSFCQSMKKYKREETFLRVVWIGLQNWVYNDFNEQLPKGDEINEEEYEALGRAYSKQTIIGWDHFLVGKIVEEWKVYYALRVSGDSLSDGKAMAFSVDLVNSVWAFSLRVWKSHNDSVHGKRGRYSDRDLADLKICVEEMYESLGPTIDTEDEWLFREEVRIKILKPASQILGWMQRVMACFDEDMENEFPVLVKAKYIVQRMCTGSIHI